MCQWLTFSGHDGLRICHGQNTCKSVHAALLNCDIIVKIDGKRKIFRYQLSDSVQFCYLLVLWQSFFTVNFLELLLPLPVLIFVNLLQHTT